MATLVTYVTGRRAKLVVLGLWVLMVGALGPFAGRFEAAQRNESSSFLPKDAESVKVLKASGSFPSGTVTPAVVVFRDSGGLGIGDRRILAVVRRRVGGAGIEGARPPSPVIFSADGKAAAFTIPIEAKGDDKLLIDAVKEVRRLVRQDLPRGLQAKVTGPAAFSADASKAFEGINTTLLLVTAGLVLLLLVLIYRSPFLWILPLASVLFAEAVVRALGYLLTRAGAVINGQTAGILLVLVFGAGTDYALLLTARYREELQRVDDKHEAMAVALRRGGPAIVASAGTVIAALLCLALAEVSSFSGLGPIAAIGVAVAALAMLTLLPALLLIAGRRAFWPFVPRKGTESDLREGIWGRIGPAIERAHRWVWIGSTAALAALALGLVTLDDNLTTTSYFRGSVESVEGQRLLEQSAGASAPATVLVRDEAYLASALRAARSVPSVASVGNVERGARGARFEVTLRYDPFSEGAFRAIRQLRDSLGGTAAEEVDLRQATSRDTWLLVPLVLVVVFTILVLLLRSLVAPSVLMGSALLSFFAALGGSLLLLDLLAGFPKEDPSYPLLAFIFLVPLGVDYNIFLMTRVRDEAIELPTRKATLKALAVTGGVITSAGIVLAGTFSVLALLPLVPLTQIGVTVALGILLDTFVVRSMVVPALTWELGERIWWPRSRRRA